MLAIFVYLRIIFIKRQHYSFTDLNQVRFYAKQ